MYTFRVKLAPHFGVPGGMLTTGKFTYAGPAASPIPVSQPRCGSAQVAEHGAEPSCSQLSATCFHWLQCSESPRVR